MTIKTHSTLPNIISFDEWQTAVDRQLINAKQYKLPMVKIDKNYVFDCENGTVNLIDLFENRRHLIIYHFMFDPLWTQGCYGCSRAVDAMSHPAHLHIYDTSLVLISRAPFQKLENYKTRMGWDLPWYSSFHNDFEHDFNVTTDYSKYHGTSVLLREDDEIYYLLYRRKWC